MFPELGRGPGIGGGGNNEESFGEELERELGMLLHERRWQEQESTDSNSERECELNRFKSGSSSPNVEGSSAVGGLFSNGNGGFLELVRSKDSNVAMSEEDLRSDPTYYHSNMNLNPRLLPPLLSKEDRRLTQRLQGGGTVVGSIGDSRKVTKTENGPGRSPFLMPPGFKRKKEEEKVQLEKVQGTANWGQGGLPGIGLGPKQKSFAEIFQNDMGCSDPPSRHLSLPTSRNAFDENVDALGSVEAELAVLQREAAYIQGSSAAKIHGPSATQNVATPTSYSYAGALGSSLLRSNTPDPQHIARVPSLFPTPIGEGRVGLTKKIVTNAKSFNSMSSGTNDSFDPIAAFSGRNLATNCNIDNGNHFLSQLEQEHFSNMHSGYEHGKQQAFLNRSIPGHIHMPSAHHSCAFGNIGVADSWSPQGERLKAGSNFGVSYSKTPTPYSLNGDVLPPHHNHLDGSHRWNYGICMMDSQLGNYDAYIGNASQASLQDAIYFQQLISAEYSAHMAALTDKADKRSVELPQKAYLGSVMSPKTAQFGTTGNKPKRRNRRYYGNHAFDIVMVNPGSPLSSPVISNLPGGFGNPSRQKDLSMRNANAIRNIGGGSGLWHMDSSLESSLLEEFKSNKTKSFELSEIANHVVEFSADQYRSRFIQQKLETATVDEKNMVFEEIKPHAVFDDGCFWELCDSKVFRAWTGSPNKRAHQ